jgi:hypothetical protein
MLAEVFVLFFVLCGTCGRIILQRSLLLSIYTSSNYPTEISYYTSFSHFHCCVLTSLSFILSSPSFLFPPFAASHSVPSSSILPPHSSLYFHSALFNSLFALFILLRFSFLGGWECSVNKSPATLLPSDLSK